MKTVLLSAVATIALAATTACSDTAPQPTEVDAQALLASAPSWQPTDLTADLEVDEPTRARINDDLRAMHTSMLDVHARYEAALALDGAERAAAIDALEPDIVALHEQHRTLWASLDENVATALRARIHEVMAEHDDGAMQTLHDRMRRLFGAAHDAHDAGR